VNIGEKMLIEIIAPSPGESIAQVVLASWLAAEGVWVKMDAEVAEIESDKATLMIFAPASGVLKTNVPAGSTINVGAVIGWIDADAQPELTSPKETVKKNPSIAGTTSNAQKHTLHLTPLAKQVAAIEKISADQLIAIEKEKITKADVELLLQKPSDAQNPKANRPVRRIKMSPLRQKLAERLVSVKNETAMLTTFNEVDMSEIANLRKQYGDQYKALHGNNISFLSFFVMAAQRAFSEFPQINAAIDGDEIIYHDYADICLAVSTPKGLMAPAIRDVQQLSLAQIDHCIRDFGLRAQTNKITLDELHGGTFTITNGGTFGSMLSTPLINPPQSAILGMHKIEDRPVVIQGKIAIRPMMYIALSYDHRLIDGKESVGFLVRVKEYLENPLSLNPGGQANPALLLGLL
jgi:2-oxoglutarate dehydrogenase E2 component (dihydrolipoamide succinyltransferase)